MPGQTFANAVVNMSPVSNILSMEEIAVANQILERKPSTIQEDLFQSIKNMIFEVPQAEYLLVSACQIGGSVLASYSICNPVQLVFWRTRKGS